MEKKATSVLIGRIAVLLLTLVLGICLGRLWPRAGRDEFAIRPTGGEGSGSPSRDRRLPNRVPLAESAANQLRTASDIRAIEIDSATLERLALQMGARVPEFHLFEADDPSLDFIGITESEKVSLEEAWEGAKEGMKGYAAQVSVYRWEDDDSSVAITVPPLGEEGARQREFLAGEIREILGETRASGFLALKRIGEVFGSGGEEQKYTIFVEFAGNGFERYRIIRRIGDEERQWIADAIPDEIRHLTNAAGIEPRVHDIALEEGEEVEGYE